MKYFENPSQSLISSLFDPAIVGTLFKYSLELRASLRPISGITTPSLVSKGVSKVSPYSLPTLEHLFRKEFFEAPLYLS